MNMNDERKLFMGTAYYYAKYRAKYPPEFFEHITKIFHLDGKGRLLDLGCGTGQITLPFARYFAEVVGLDPEQEMLDEAAREAKEAGIKNAKWICDKAENINNSLGVFRLITMGKSFHWMDRKTVLQKSYGILEKGGGLIIAGPTAAPGKDGWRVDEDNWREARKKVVKKYFGEKRRAGSGFYQEPGERFETLLVQSPFRNCEEWTYKYTRSMTLDETVNEIYSASYVSREELGDKLSDFERDMREVLLQIEPSGSFVEHITLQALIARK